MTPTLKTDRRVFACRVDRATPAAVDAVAAYHGCLRVDGSGKVVGSCGAMLDAIASGDLKVIVNKC